MKNKKGTSLLKIDNFLVETDKINSSDETFNKLMFLYSAALTTRNKNGYFKGRIQLFLRMFNNRSHTNENKKA